jgi:hypothetical protein
VVGVDSTNDDLVVAAFRVLRKSHYRYPDTLQLDEIYEVHFDQSDDEFIFYD